MGDCLDAKLLLLLLLVAAGYLAAGAGAAAAPALPATTTVHDPRCRSEPEGKSLSPVYLCWSETKIGVLAGTTSLEVSARSYHLLCTPAEALQLTFKGLNRIYHWK